MHYARVINICCFLFLFTNIGLPSTSFGVYQPYIVDIAGVGDLGGSIILALRTAMSLVAMIVVNMYYRRLDCRRGIALACLLTAIGFFIYGLADGMAPMCVGAVFAGTGYGLGGMVGMTILVNRWFKSHVGRAIGLSAVGSGFASFLVPMAAVCLVENFSLQVSFWAEGAFALFIGVIVLLLLRDRPGDMGIEPYHDEKEDKVPEAALHKHKHERELPDNIYLSPFHLKLIYVAIFFLGVICICSLGYFNILMTSCGFTTMFAATVFSVCGICLTVSKYATGEIFDMLGARRGTTIFFFVAVAGLLLAVLMPTGNIVVAVASGILLGAGLSLGTVGIPIWSLDLSHPDQRARIIKNFQICYALGGFVFNIVPGLLKELTGTYVITYVIMAAMAVVSALFIVFVYAKYRHAWPFLHDRDGHGFVLSRLFDL